MGPSQLKWGGQGMSARAASCMLCMLLSPHAVTPVYTALETAWRQRQGIEGAEGAEGKGQGARRRVADKVNEKAAARQPASLVPILFLFK